MQGSGAAYGTRLNFNDQAIRQPRQVTANDTSFRFIPFQANVEFRSQRIINSTAKYTAKYTVKTQSARKLPILLKIKRFLSIIELFEYECKSFS